jgi:hypothetical protein
MKELCATAGLLIALSGAASVFAGESAALRIAPSPLLQIEQYRISVVEGIVATWQDALSVRYGSNAAEQQLELRAALVTM